MLASMTSCMVSLEVWVMSTIIPNLFISYTTWNPNSDKPLLLTGTSPDSDTAESPLKLNIDQLFFIFIGFVG